MCSNSVCVLFLLWNHGYCSLIAAHPISSCVSCVGLLVQDLTDIILSSYAYKSHYLLTESNRAELKLPMIPSSWTATKKNIGKGNITVLLSLPFPTGACVWMLVCVFECV